MGLFHQYSPKSPDTYNSFGVRCLVLQGVPMRIRTHLAVASVFACVSIGLLAQAPHAPQAVVVVIDASASMTYINQNMTSAFGFAVEAVPRFLARMRPDQAKLGFFHEEISLMPDFTSDPARLRAALLKIEREPHPRFVLRGGNASRVHDVSRIYDAIVLSVESLQAVPAQRMLLVVSDGRDTASSASWEEAAGRAVAAAVVVHAVSPMPLGPGTTLGSYAVTAKIGEDEATER